MKIAQLLIIEKNGKESMKVGTHLKCNVHPFVSDTFGFLFTNRPDYIVVTTRVDKLALEEADMIVDMEVDLVAGKMPFHVYHQLACPNGYISTLVAFIWLFAAVCFQMCPQSVCTGGYIVDLVAFV